jgi:Lar family restriction alleviation protein
MQNEKDSCPRCGALPADWVDDPHAAPLNAARLKPCPFCGSQDVKLREFEPECFVVACDGCNAEGGYNNSENESTTPEEAVSFWNDRPA